MRVLVPVLVIVLLAVGAVGVYVVRARLTPPGTSPNVIAELEGRLAEIPLAVGDGRYVGRHRPLSDEVVRQAGADVHTSIQYGDPEGNLYQLYVGGSVSNEEDFHAPSYCMNGSGWEIVVQDTVPVRAAIADHDDVRMRRLRLQRGSEHMTVYYYFQAGRRVADHEWGVRFYRFLDLLAGAPLRPTHIVTIYATTVEPGAYADSAIQAFIAAIAPQIHDAISLGDR